MMFFMCSYFNRYKAVHVVRRPPLLVLTDESSSSSSASYALVKNHVHRCSSLQVVLGVLFPQRILSLMILMIKFNIFPNFSYFLLNNWPSRQHAIHVGSFFSLHIHCFLSCVKKTPLESWPSGNPDKPIISPQRGLFTGHESGCCTISREPPSRC